jgi:hypothetical protein
MRLKKERALVFTGVPDLANLATKGVSIASVREGEFEQIMAQPAGVGGSGWRPWWCLCLQRFCGRCRA